MLKDPIRVIGARQNNLQNLTLSLPRHQLIVFCGWSGSGKSSLAFDTIYAEGFSSYVESLSTYIRQFLSRLPRPQVDRIEGLAPAIALSQNRFTGGMRSTVATLTDLYPYLRLLFARVGTLYSPVSGLPVERHTLEDALQFILQQPEGTLIYILRPLVGEGPLEERYRRRIEEGQDRFFYRGTLYELPEEPPFPLEEELFEVVDRVFLDPTEVGLRARIMESLEEVWYAHERTVWIHIADKGDFIFRGHLHADGYTFREPTPELFNFLSSYGSCPHCHARGKALSLREEAVIPDPRRTLKEGLVALWTLPIFDEHVPSYLEALGQYIPLDLPYYRYSTQQKRLLWWGDPLKKIPGIFSTFTWAQKTSPSRWRYDLAAFQGEGPCPVCEGTRLHPDTRWIRIADRSLPQVLSLSIEEFAAYLASIDLPEPRRSIAKPLLEELTHRTQFLLEVGLGYLTLDRAAETLSGGESQRIQLAATLGGQLTGAIYVLDEPTIGLHPRNTEQLLSAVRKLQAAPNTVIVVEHDPLFIRSADWIVELGPEAGENGGKIVFEGTFQQLLQSDTHTARYFRTPPPSPPPPQSYHTFLEIQNACLHNLKNISVRFPLPAFSVVTGVSGSGKTTLIFHLLARHVQGLLLIAPRPYQTSWATFHLPEHAFSRVEVLSQDNLPRNRRSVIATVSGIYDSIREIFHLASERKGTPYPASYFSFNVEGGRCETCKGEGVIVRPMQFLADIRLPCPACQGRRFQRPILEVEIEKKSISDILEMTATEARSFFKSLRGYSQNLLSDIDQGLSLLEELGLGYLRLGQSTVELSGGEATRLRLLPYLLPHAALTLFLIDEPTVGLHYDDVKRLVRAFRKLVEAGHSLIVIEHNLDLIAQADWVVDLGPEGGDAGGEVLFQGPVADLLNHPTSYTAKALRELYDHRSL
jgi:excinuclease ABC subunit A